MWGQPEGLTSSVSWVGEWCAMGWGVELRGNPVGRLGPQEKQSAIAGENERRRGGLP